jgi:hypothetical protein
MRTTYDVAGAAKADAGSLGVVQHTEGKLVFSHIAPDPLGCLVDGDIDADELDPVPHPGPGTGELGKQRLAVLHR